MVKGTSRQVIVVQTPEPKLFEQAIFILRGGSSGKPDSGIIKEAQDIIDDYIRKVGGVKDFSKASSFPPKPQRKRMGLGLVTVMVSAVLLSMVVLVRFLAG